MDNNVNEPPEWLTDDLENENDAFQAQKEMQDTIGLLDRVTRASMLRNLAWSRKTES